MNTAWCRVEATVLIPIRGYFLPWNPGSTHSCLRPKSHRPQGVIPGGGLIYSVCLVRQRPVSQAVPRLSDEVAHDDGQYLILGYVVVEVISYGGESFTSIYHTVVVLVVPFGSPRYGLVDVRDGDGNGEVPVLPSLSVALMFIRYWLFLS